MNGLLQIQVKLLLAINLGLHLILTLVLMILLSLHIMDRLLQVQMLQMLQLGDLAQVILFFGLELMLLKLLLEQSHWLEMDMTQLHLQLQLQTQLNDFGFFKAGGAVASPAFLLYRKEVRYRYDL